MEHAADLQHLRINVSRSHGDAPLDLREHVEMRAAQLSGRAADHREVLPPGVRELVEKVAQNAYKVTDHDITHLLHEGYSEDAIFEIVVCAAVGAGAARFERAMEALKSAPAEG
ncbi:MAG: hypothetical protein ACYS0E_21320 [Planctomycetota bacterium]|jgi:alkylhydroperoxidase/carboxymuconolactone decarboxylase family protein YurZ